MEMKHCLAVFMLISFGLSVAASAQTRVRDVRDVENPARQPFVVEGPVNFDTKELSVDIGEVPAGKRAVIEFISMLCQTESPDTIVFVQFLFRNAATNGFPHYHLPIAKQGDPGVFQSWVAAQPVRIYADEGKIAVQVGRSNQTLSSRNGCFVNVSGHTIDVDRN
jgi:hypothetical protein